MTWEKPPTRDAVDWDAAGRELMTRPGEFKIVATYAAPGSAASSAHQIRAGKKKALAALGQFEAKARTVRGEFRVYARYVGPGSASPEPGPPAGGAE